MLNTLFQNPTQQVLKKYTPLVTKINNLEPNFQRKSDEELRDYTISLKNRILVELEENILIEAFALVREASRRVLGLRHYDVQLIGGIVLTEQNIAEMKTGEGKTLVALLPTFLNALYGKGAHVITVNDYLAKRDSESVGSVHKFLGLTVGLIQEGMDTAERKLNYACDVVYLTNNELGFDYLRDNLAIQESEIVQRELSFCLVDEVDSILIDEARTPLIISGTAQTPTEKYLLTAKLAESLKRDIHYKVDEKAQNVTLTTNGILFCEQALAVDNLYKIENPWIGVILNSIKAKELYLKDKNYIVSETNEVIIVDEFTGRVMVGRRWSDGLHQAVEAKENVTINEESQTLASITYQNLFLLYNKLCGMTGTAKTEENEFEKIYKLKVLPIPTNLPNKRNDFADVIYKNQYLKWQAITQECIEMYTIGRPVLIGTTTIEKSELLATLLSEYDIPYQLLNAKPENVEKESEIIAQAGRKKAITIATNMAGRGTDILLGGNISYLLGDFKEKNTEYLEETLPNINEKKNQLKIEREEVKNLGGLHVIGTERHDSRRIDNQLRGRAGRQGDPGSSKFFLCLEDKLLKVFGGDQILEAIQNIGFDETIPIQSPLLTKSLDSAQKKVETYFFESRKQLFDYDQALDQQRRAIYSERLTVLKENNLRKLILAYAERSLYDTVSLFKKNNFDLSINSKVQNLLGLPFNFKNTLNEDFISSLDFYQQQIHIAYDIKELELELMEKGLIRELETSFILQAIDFSWKEH